MRFRSFPSLEEAVRFVIGDKSESRVQSVVESANQRYENEEIELLYGRSDFPTSSKLRPELVAPRGAFWLLKPAPRYEIRRDTRGTWSVIKLDTGEAVSINGVLMTRMGVREAEAMAEILNGQGEQDMLALGP